MDYYYPNHIAGDYYDDEISSCCSAEIEGGVVGAGVDLRAASGGAGLDGEQPTPDGELGESDKSNGNVNAGRSSCDNGPLGGSSHTEQDINGESHIEKDALQVSRHADISMNGSQHGSTATGAVNEQKQQPSNPMAALIQNERNRRLGVRGTDAIKDHSPTPKSSNIAETPAAPSAARVLGNIRGWFGGVGAAAGTNTHQSPMKQPPYRSSTLPMNHHNDPSQAQRRSSAPTIHVDGNLSHPLNTSSHGKRGSEHLPPASSVAENASYNTGDDDDISSGSSDEYSSSDDIDSSSHSSDDSNNQKLGDADFTPQERARARALRYLSNSCVDAGRKAKTASYTRGLERLDLKRKRDRYDRELEIVESEMNKDRGLINGRERDPISALAARLVRELPRIQDADAGAGSSGGDKSFMSYDEYANALNADNSGGSDQQQTSLWDNKPAVDVYVTSLQNRLKGALEHTRSLEKRLVVLEQAGDDIVSSLCEDLADVTGHSNKAEARYVKKGKELQRKQRREELRHRSKIKQWENHIRKLEEELLRVNMPNEYSKSFEGSDITNGDSTLSGDNDVEDDDILLEKKLSKIKVKSEQDKDQHDSEIDSVRRQCEQLKLRLSVARLVMEGDDNLREYMAILDRLNPSTRFKRNSIDFNKDEELSSIHESAIPSPPPSRITRTRAKLLKVALLESMYEQRLAVSKAFTDATINALEEELLEREEASQKMEVRCLNDLMLIDSGIKDMVDESSHKLKELEAESQELEDAVAACVAQKSVSDVNGMFGSDDAPTETPKPKPLQVENDVGDEPEELFAKGVIPLNTETLPREKSIEENRIEDEEDGTGLASEDADSIQIESNVVDEYAQQDTIQSHDGRRKKLPLADDIEKKIAVEDEQDETGIVSDTDSLQIESDIAVESSHQDTIQNHHGWRKKMPLADDIDTISVDSDGNGASSCEVVDYSPPDTLQSSCDSIEKATYADSTDAYSVEADDKGASSWEDAKLSPLDTLESSCETEAKAAISAATNSESIDADDSRAYLCENAELISPDILQSSCEPIEKAAVSAATDSMGAVDIDGEGINATSCESTVSANSAVGNFGSFDEATDNSYQDHMSDDDSFMHENNVVDESPMPTTRVSNDSNAESIGLAPLDNAADEQNHVVRHLCSFDEPDEIDFRDDQKLDELYSSDTGDASMASPQNEKEINTEVDFEDMNFTDTAPRAIKKDSVDEKTDSNGSSSSNVGQLKSQPEICSTDQLCSGTAKSDNLMAESSSAGMNGVNDGDLDDFDPGKTNDNVPQGCYGGTNARAADHCSNEIDHEKVIKTKYEDVAKRREKSPPQKKAVMELLGRELQCTLAEYQTSFDLSSSRERVEQLEYMNNLVLKIAKVKGMECQNNSVPSGEGELTSWSLKKTKSFRGSSDKKRHEKKRSKKKKKRRHRDRKEKEVIIGMDGLAAHDQTLVW